MAEYCLAIYRRNGRFPRQILLYVGNKPLSMASELRGDRVWFAYEIVDIRNLDGEVLLESPELGDNVIAILACLRDQKEAVRRIVGRIAKLEPSERAKALDQLSIVAGLRRLIPLVEQEAHKMAIDWSVLREDPVLGPIWDRAEEAGLQKGLLEGRQEGRQEGSQEGRQEAALTMLRRQIEKRFGPIPAWAEVGLSHRTAPELEELGIRLLDAQTIEELLQS